MAKVKELGKAKTGNYFLKCGFRGSVTEYEGFLDDVLKPQRSQRNISARFHILSI